MFLIISETSCNCFTAVKAAAMSNALFLFSTETGGEDKDYQLQKSGRYAHSRKYIEEIATQNKLLVEACSFENCAKIVEFGFMEIITY